MKGIHHWHTRMFEKLGWMVLAKEKGYDYKVDAYKKSTLKVFKVEEKSEEVKNVDKYKRATEKARAEATKQDTMEELGVDDDGDIEMYFDDKHIAELQQMTSKLRVLDSTSSQHT